MKASQVYLRAAELWDSGEHPYIHTMRYAALQIDGKHHVRDVSLIWDYFGDANFDNQEHGVLALCVMSAIAADEEGSRK